MGADQWAQSVKTEEVKRFLILQIYNYYCVFIYFVNKLSYKTDYVDVKIISLLLTILLLLHICNELKNI
jgi:hypothetical protein